MNGDQKVQDNTGQQGDVPPADTGVNVQGYQPPQNQQEWVQQQQNPQQPVQYPAQYPQYSQYIPQSPQVPSPSPEVPARVDKGEAYSSLETASQVEQQPRKPSDKIEESKKLVDAPEEAPDIKRFENPYQVSGYKPSAQIMRLAGKNTNSKARGRTNLAETWLILLLGRILKMQHEH